MTNLALVKPNDWHEYAVQIAAIWQKSVTGIVETGRALQVAKEALPHGSFTKMIESELPFGKNTALRLMAIARHPILSKSDHAHLLPASWANLYMLTRVKDDVLTARIQDKTVNPKIERKQILRLLPKPRSKKPLRSAPLALPKTSQHDRDLDFLRNAWAAACESARAAFLKEIGNDHYASDKQ